MTRRFHAAGPCIGFLLCIACILIQCNKPTSYNKFLDPELVKLADFADHRTTDSVLTYLTHRQPMLRVEAAYALASVRDPKAVDALHKAVLDPVAEVRTAAAYALGQLLHPSSIEPLSKQLLIESNAAAVISICEALGKIAGGLHASSTAPEWVENSANALFNFERSDSIGVHAVAKAAFWLHNAGWDDTRFMNKLSALFPSQPVINRRMIAFAMGRYRGEWFTDTLQCNRFLQALEVESDTLTRTASMAVSAKCASSQAAGYIRACLLSSQPSLEWTLASCRAAGKHTGIEAASILPLLSDNRTSVAEEACIALQSKKLTADEVNDLSLRMSSFPITVQAACARLLHQNGATLNVESWLGKIDGNLPVYDRLSCIRALGVTGKCADVCLERALQVPDILEANAYTEAFIESHNKVDFPAGIPFAESLRNLILRSDIGITALCAAELRNDSISTAEKQLLNTTLLEALERCALPKEVETANEIIKTLNAWGITPREEIKVTFNHPIDWELVKSIPRRQHAIIETSQGTIEIELHVEDAPGSVASFVSLCRSGFFDGKSFHRVVPNFVIQGGCPRGDGMGGTDYTLRSEFRLHDYSSGAVGLASSGPDTESCQWFITHIPTPHLEGRYTIFAHVVKGMDVVDKISVGDSILRITLP
jgi:cyclophilin family peptidyl-prolyl cis-trans isomerase